MCFYILLLPTCGHAPPTLLAAPGAETCPALLAQLLRIYDEPGSDDDDDDANIPFDLPAECSPSPDNTQILFAGDYCGWECRNNHYVATAALGSPVLGELGGNHMGLEAGSEGFLAVEENRWHQIGFMGMPEASYGPGSERMGVGWRY